MENQTLYVINVGLNVGLNDNLRVNEDKLNKSLEISVNLLHTIEVRLKGELYTTYYDTKVEEDTNVYIFTAHENFEVQRYLQYLCNTFEQICIPYKIYDKNLYPVYSDMIFSNKAKEEDKKTYGEFQNEYFCNPFKF